MNIKCLKEFDLGMKLGEVRSATVSLGPEMGEAVLFAYTEEPGVDPWQEAVHYPKDTLKLALFAMNGMMMWKKDLGWGNIPGVWYTPFVSFDLDQDGVDEIYFVNNLSEERPFSLKFRVLERLDPFTGETTGRWPWPDYVEPCNMSATYRFFITGGYVHGEPVLVTAQGTYMDMYLQAYSKGMEKRWEIVIPKEDQGPKACHSCPVLDFNEDGIDELFWGERLISLDDGHEVICADKGKYTGHSDVVVPFYDDKTGKKYIYTCREDDEREGVPRVVTYDDKGERVWAAIDDVGHMHHGWVANLGPDHRKVAMAMRIMRIFEDGRTKDTRPEHFYFDAITGEPLEQPVPFEGSEFMPVDFNGDGYHEFYGTHGRKKGYVVDKNGNFCEFIGGEQIRSGKILDLPGEQMMVFYGDQGKVRIWGDASAVESEYCKKRFAHSYHHRIQHFMGTGYNHIYSRVTCGM